MAWERNRDRFRISHACRTVEVAHGYKHDHGLYMARVHAGQATTIELATVAERMAWKAERQQDRLEERVRRTLGDYATFENPQTWQESVVARLHEHADKYRDAGVEPFWADAHLLAAEWNGRLRKDDAGAIQLDLWERIPEAEIIPRHIVDEHGEDVEIPGLAMRPTGVSLPIARDDLPFAGEFIDFDVGGSGLRATRTRGSDDRRPGVDRRRGARHVVAQRCRCVRSPAPQRRRYSD